MLFVYYELYYDDAHKSENVQDFSNLKEFEDWIFRQMRQKYSEDGKCIHMYFPTDEPTCFRFTPSSDGAGYKIFMIRGENGIIYSDGTATNGVKFWTKEVREWLKDCKERQSCPTFDFAPEDSEEPKPKPMNESRDWHLVIEDYSDPTDVAVYDFLTAHPNESESMDALTEVIKEYLQTHENADPDALMYDWHDFQYFSESIPADLYAKHGLRPVTSDTQISTVDGSSIISFAE